VIESRNAAGMLVGKPEGNRNNIKVDLNRVKCVGED
jgi:hypothetical protein